ncbi:MAG: ribosomal protein [Acidobacteria bacterium]|nr:ribosomal protein [Acidobacteriota bacterium]
MPPSKARAKRRDEKPGRRRDERPGRRIKKKVCYFCAEGIEHVDYKDVALLRKFMSDRAKIRSSRVTGNCVRHQRLVARAIKNARELALLSYTNR